MVQELEGLGKQKGNVICSLELPLTLIIFTDCMAGRVQCKHIGSNYNAFSLKVFKCTFTIAKASANSCMLRIKLSPYHGWSAVPCIKRFRVRFPVWAPTGGN